MLNTRELIEIGSILQKGLDSDQTFSLIFDLLERTISFDSATLFLYDKEKDALEVVLKRGEFIVDLADEISFGRGKGISSFISQQKKPVVLQSLAKSRPGKHGRFSSFLSLPLWIADKLVGVLNVGHDKPDVYQKDEIENYTLMASQISLVVEKLTLRNQVEEQNRQLTQALEDLTRTQEKLVDAERLAAIGELVVTVNHKINNPLSSIVTYSELLPLMIETRNTKKALQAAKMIHDGAMEIKKVTHQLQNLNNAERVEYLGDVSMLKLPEE
jgi:GAF domain-containing protein